MDQFFMLVIIYMQIYDFFMIRSLTGLMKITLVFIIITLTSFIYIYNVRDVNRIDKDKRKETVGPPLISDVAQHMHCTFMCVCVYDIFIYTQISVFTIFQRFSNLKVNVSCSLQRNSSFPFHCMRDSIYILAILCNATTIKKSLHFLEDLHLYRILQITSKYTALPHTLYNAGQQLSI